MSYKKSVHPGSIHVTLANSEARPTIPMCVGELMTSRLVTLSPDHTFKEAVGLMTNRPFRHFLVLEKNGQLAGVISDRDLMRVLARDPDWESTTVSEVMTRDPLTVQPETPLSSAVVEVLARRINCLPVVGMDGRACGIVTSTDLLQAFQQVQARLEDVQQEALDVARDLEEHWTTGETGS